MLIVGCGCRGRELAAALQDRGHAVRGTSRTQEGRDAIESAGFEGAVADPQRLGTLLPLLEGVSVVCWLLANATGDADDVAALHGPRLQSMLDRLVDSPARGMVYQADGVAPAELLEEGAAIVEAAGRTYRMPVRLVGASPSDSLRGVEEILAG